MTEIQEYGVLSYRIPLLAVHPELYLGSSLFVSPRGRLQKSIPNANAIAEAQNAANVSFDTKDLTWLAGPHL